MASINDLARLKSRIEMDQQAAAKAAGAYEQTMERLRNEFGCRTIQEAEEKLKRMGEKIAAAEKEFDAALEQYRKEFGGE